MPSYLYESLLDAFIHSLLRLLSCDNTLVSGAQLSDNSVHKFMVDVVKNTGHSVVTANSYETSMARIVAVSRKREDSGHGRLYNYK